MVFNYDYFGLAEPAQIYLCKTDNSIVCELNGIDLTTVSYKKQINNFDTIQFDVHKYVNGEESNGYDMLDEAMYLFVDGIGYFRMSYPQVSNDGFDEYKTVTAQSCECELALKTLKNFKINTGETDSREYLIDDNVKETDEGVKIAKNDIVLYSNDSNFSLLDIALEKVYGWEIGYVDKNIIQSTVIETKVNDDGTVTTTSKTINSKRSFDIDSKSVYAFLTQDVAKKFECVFEFNIMNRKINVYDINKYGKDSNVFISYRNLIQTLNYAPAQEDNIMTRFDVRGADDLTIDAVNFGSSTIENLSYYLSTKHVSQELIDHYNEWLSKLDEARKKYMYYNRQYSLYMEKRDEVNLRVPNDGLNNNWKQFTVDELDTIKKKYTLYMGSLKDNDLGYWDEDNQKWLNKGAEQDYIAYQGILEIIDKTIEYKKNNDPSKDDEKSDEVDDLIEEWNTNWDLFGLKELQTKEKTYLSNIDTLKAYAKAWKDLDKEQQGHLTESNYNISHNKYLKYLGYEYGKDENGNPYTEAEKGGCSLAIKQRKEEYINLQEAMTGFSNSMSEVAKINDKEKCGIFTKEDLATLNKLYNDTDYTNENILTISTDTAAEIINTQYELFEDATTELSKVCQPQLSFTLTMDNIFAIPGFKEWQGNFDIGNFIHLSFDDNDQYFLKLRISSLTFNPCVIENSFEIEFTNMIDYNGGRNDFAVLLDESVSTAKNQITGSVKNKLDTSGIEVSDSLIKALVNSTQFTNAVSNGVFNTVSANTGSFGSLLSKTINAQELIANSGLFETIDAGNGNIRNVLALEVNASRMSVGTLAVDRLIIRGEKSIMYEINSTTGLPSQTTLSKEELNKYYMSGENLQVESVAADRIIAHSINAEQITTDNIRGLNGWINLAKGTFLFFSGFENDDKKYTSDQLDKLNAEKWGKTLSGLSWDGSQLSVKGDITAINLTLGENASVKGIVYATGGSFTGDIIANSLTLGNGIGAVGEIQSSMENPDGSGYFKVSKNGLLVADNAYISGTIYANAGTFSGELKAATGSFTGNISADTGNIGGWNISDGGIYHNSDQYTVYLSNGSNSSKDYLVVKDNVNNNWPFYVHADGYLYSQKGKIGGWDISLDALSKGDGYGASGGAYLGSSGLSVSDKFSVDNSGVLTANDANISGTITASSGTIGGIKILSDGLYGGEEITGDRGAVYKFGISTNSNNHVFWSGEDTFYVNQDGYMHCSNADISGSVTTTDGSISTVNGNKKVLLEQGMLYAMSGSNQKISLGIDSGGVNAWLQFYGDKYTDIGMSIGYSGVRCKDSTYRIPIGSTATEDGFVASIRSYSNKIGIKGLFGSGDWSTREISVPASDARLKKNISDTKVINALNQILNIKHREFDWKLDNTHVDIGYIAQELEKINPHLVFKPEDETGIYTINTFYMEGLITKSIQEMYYELKKENEALKKRIKKLENELI